jgi:hypothetical protein
MEGGPYTATWAEYRRSARQYIAVFLGGPVVVLVVTAGVKGALGERAGNWVFGALWLAMMALLARGSYKHFNWPCPRCGEPFFRKVATKNSFTRRCLHCALPKWASGPDAR